MNKDEMQEFKSSIVAEIKGIFVEGLTDVRSDISEIRGGISEIRSDIAGLDNRLAKLEVSIEEESAKNSALLNEIIASQTIVQNSLPPIIERIQNLEKDVLLLKMTVFQNEKVSRV